MRLEPRTRYKASRVIAAVLLLALLSVVTTTTYRLRLIRSPPTSNFGRPPLSANPEAPSASVAAQPTVVLTVAIPSADPIVSAVPPSSTLLSCSGSVDDVFVPLSQVRSAEAVKEYSFFQLQEVSSNRWLSRPVDTNVAKASSREKALRIQFHKKYKAYSIKGHTRMHLTCELNNKVTIDRLWARSFEQWRLHFDSVTGEMMLESRRNSMFVRLTENSEALVADAPREKAARWRLFGISGGACGPTGTKGGKGSVLEQQCWGKDECVSVQDEARARKATYLLFGSPKPIARLVPLKENDPFDSFIIANRTLTNWGTIDGVQPLIFTDDEVTTTLVRQINERAANPIKLTKEFEVQPQFSQPTYRGLFATALRQFPSVDVAMYSNSDILYTPALAETILRVVDYVEKEKQRKLASGEPYRVKGWMIVGQRVNHQVPAEWTINRRNTSAWVHDIEHTFAKGGELFESDAEDYFIVSRGLFDWMTEIPDFVVGGVAFDNWITSKVNKMALKGTAIVVDATKTIVALHQNHGHNVKDSHKHPKSIYNSNLAAHNGGWSLGHTADALYATERRADGVICVYDKHRLLYS